MGSVIARCGQIFPFVERRISSWLGLLPFAYAVRPADFGSLITRISYGVIRNRIEPSFFLRKLKNVLVDPIFQAKRKRPVLNRLRCDFFFGLKKSRAPIVKNLP